MDDRNNLALELAAKRRDLCRAEAEAFEAKGEADKAAASRRTAAEYDALIGEFRRMLPGATSASSEAVLVLPERVLPERDPALIPHIAAAS